METLATFHIAHLPTQLAVYIALFRDLRNASFLRQQLLAGNADFEYAFLDAASVRSVTVKHQSTTDYSLGFFYDPCSSCHLQSRDRHAKPADEVTQRTFRDSFCLES